MATLLDRDNATAPACIANIGARGRRKRATVGVVSFGVGGLIVATLVVMRVSPVWRLASFFPFWAGALGVFQAREKT